MGNSFRGKYPEGTIIQRRDGKIYVKTAGGLIPQARHLATISSKVYNGGEDLQPGWRVMHLDMSTYGEEDHDRPENLVVIKCRPVKVIWEPLKQTRIIKMPSKTSLSKLVHR